MLDHTRTVLLTVGDGSLPSNVGGGNNVRNILRRSFSIMEKNDWWESIGMKGFLKIFDQHKQDLQGIFGKFPPHKSFDKIIEVEYDRWKFSDFAAQNKLEKFFHKKKGKLKPEDWIMMMESYGVSADKIAETTKLPIPSNLYELWALKQERTSKKVQDALYETAHLPKTKLIFHEDKNKLNFEAKVVDVLENKKDGNKRNIVVLDQSAVYPTSGGQAHDTGSL